MTEYIYLKQSPIKYKTLAKNDVAYVLRKSGNSLYVLFLRENIEVTVDSKNVCSFDITKVGDRFDKKICDRCCKLLDTKLYFSDNRLKKNNVITKRPSCKDCRKKKDGVSIKSKDREVWESKRPKAYSLFTCPLCQKTTIVGLSKVVLDHNHHTGKVRGFLCESCNTGIGRFDDDISLVKRAISWLAKEGKE
jgi:hypothetical protein